jgi:hypothetical protein
LDLVPVLKAGTITVRGVNIQPLANANQIQWTVDKSRSISIFVPNEINDVKIELLIVLR